MVALVVTIVVLLILAGITIVYVFGDNGVFGKASQAKIQTELGKIEEQAGIIYANKLIENKGGSATNREIVDKLIENGNNIEIRTAGETSITGISLEPEEVSMDENETATVKVKIEGPEDGNLYYAVIDGKYYEINFENSQLKIEREAVTPKGNSVEKAEITVETGYDTTIVTSVEINQSTKIIEITSGEKYDNTTLTIKYGSKTATCKVTVEEVESNWAEIAEMAKLIAQGHAKDEDNKEVSATSNQATVTINGENKTIKVGEIYKVKYNGIVKTVRVLGFNHDVLSDPTVAYDGTGTCATAGISFEFIEFLLDKVSNMSMPTGGWNSCVVRAFLDGEEGSGKLSNKNYLKRVRKQYLTSNNNPNSNQNYSDDALWLLSCSEIFNRGGVYGGAYASAIAKEGEQYQYYKSFDPNGDGSAYSQLIKTISKGTSGDWFLRSTCCYSSNTFSYIGYSGASCNGGGLFDAYIAPGFCI